MAKPTILIVDDSYSTTQLLERWLGFQGYRALVARSGLAGLKMIEKHSIDCVLLDVMMPDVNGITVCKTIKNQIETKHIPIIMITAFQDAEIRKKSFEAGADSFVSKPFDFDLLLEAIKSYLYKDEPVFFPVPLVQAQAYT